MNRPPSPRTEFSVPTHIPFDRTIHRMWGDDESGRIPDWIYVSGQKIHQLIFKLAPGQVFRHSENYRTLFAADVVYCILSGALVLINPETGEAHRAEAGESMLFRRDTWHHGFNDSSQVLEVLEYLAPPPMQGTTSAYASARPLPEQLRYVQDEWLGKYPMQRAEVRNAHTIHVLREQDTLLRVEGLTERFSVRLAVSTENLTVGKLRLMPGHQSIVHRHGGDEGLYVHHGQVVLCLPEEDGTGWFELRPGDGFYIPRGTAHQYVNLSDDSVELIFGVAPQYQAE